MHVLRYQLLFIYNFSDNTMNHIGNLFINDVLLGRKQGLHNYEK